MDNEPLSPAGQAGATAATVVQPLFYGMLVGGFGLRVLPWGDAAGFALLVAQIAVASLTLLRSREAPWSFAALAVFVSWYVLADLPRNAWSDGLFFATIFWGLTGTDAKWARVLAAGPAALLVAALFGFGNATVLTGRTPTVGHQVDEILHVMLLMALMVVVPHLRKEVARVAEEKDAAVAEAAQAERARIARELHDVVSHHVTVMVLQAEGAKTAVTDPKATSALTQVIASGRTALNELRRLLGVLREPAAEVEADLEPQPDLSRLPMLVDEMEGAGLTVELVVDGDAGAVAPGVGLSGYRIVQEALTNSLRHSDSDRACVLVAYERDGVLIEVTDNGGKKKRRLRSGTGSGLVGMQAWATAVGGTVDAGPRPKGGYAVQAKLPRK